MRGNNDQMTLFQLLGMEPEPTVPNFIWDMDCTVDTPVVHGLKQEPVYGKGVPIRPAIDGKQNAMYLKELLPLEAYDLIIVLLSGGKDSIACYLKLRELGVPADRIELWHHDIDGGNEERKMDWPVTQNYVKAFAEHVGSKLRTSWRQNGFFGEVYRYGASYPVQYEDDGRVETCPLTEKQLRSQELRRLIEDGADSEAIREELRSMGYRYKFPAKCASLTTRWCSSALKIDVASSVIRNLEELNTISKGHHKFPAKGSCQSGRWCSGALKASVENAVTSTLEHTRSGVNILVVSGERRGESTGRSKYNEMEIHRTNADKKLGRRVHLWRPVIDWSERDVYEIMRRHGINPHPCYKCGWNRCSCMMCIFSMPSHWAGIRELFPERYSQIRQDEIDLNFTVDNKLSLDDFVGDAASCVYHGDKAALHQLITGEYTKADIYIPPEQWIFPAGAFHGAAGGPC